MKKLLKVSTIVFLGCVMMSATGYAEEAGTETEPSAEMLERQETMKAYHEARLEAKKEKVRAKREALGEYAEEPSDPNIQGDAE